MDLFDDPIPDWTAPALPQIRGGLVGYDLETKDEGINSGKGPGWPWGGGYVVGVALAWEGGRVYLPVRHATGGNMDELTVLRYLLELMDNPNIEWATANCIYDFGWAKRWAHEHGFDFKGPAGKVCDVQILAPLLNENRTSYSLDNLGRDYLNARKDEDALKRAAAAYGIDPKKVKANLWRLPAPAVAPYAEQDASLTRDLAIHLKRLIAEEGLQEPAALEHDLVPVLLEMRWQGIRVDVDRARQLSQQYRAKEAESVALIKDKTGLVVDIWAVESVVKALAREGIQAPTLESGRPTVTKELLKGWAAQGSVVATNVLLARKFQKSYGTFTDGHILSFAQKSHGGDYRIHAEFHALRAERDDGSVFGTVSYRFSSSNPNLQQLPGKNDEKAGIFFAKEIRGVFLPEHGDELGSVDVSQQEPRMGIHFAEGANVAGGHEAAESLRTDPKWDFHDFASRLTGIPRKDVKGVSLGRMYAAGDGKIATMLGLPTIEATHPSSGRTYLKAGPEAAAILEEYERGMPWVKAMADTCKRRAESRGFITLLGGYKARFSKLGGKNGSFPKDAFNRLCQGSSAAQTKRAMVNAYRDGINIKAQVHDELVFSGTRDQGEVVRQAFLSAFADRLNVPFAVDVAFGANWGEIT